MNSSMNSFHVPNTGRNSSDMMGCFVSLFVPTCVGSYLNHMCGCSLQSNSHFGALASQPHVRCAMAPATGGREETAS